MALPSRSTPLPTSAAKIGRRVLHSSDTESPAASSSDQRGGVRFALRALSLSEQVGRRALRAALTPRVSEAVGVCADRAKGALHAPDIRGEFSRSALIARGLPGRIWEAAQTTVCPVAGYACLVWYPIRMGTRPQSRSDPDSRCFLLSICACRPRTEGTPAPSRKYVPGAQPAT